jgi:hypothetical protein
MEDSYFVVSTIVDGVKMFYRFIGGRYFIWESTPARANKMSRKHAISIRDKLNQGKWISYLEPWPQMIGSEFYAERVETTYRLETL